MAEGPSMALASEVDEGVAQIRDPGVLLLRTGGKVAEVVSSSEA
eukprot:CAMPEP_0170646470 /NCGR_PEP_ID=MMETSP0224-20130122/43657_1 /TAXON_ID=285029 /ORGANISM="Togula jolla, Strain CCCM 725" /LENGTH=43 /DNA_ID= /DNA_START= /DNA_END= /DNA_ORIENTATION=